MSAGEHEKKTEIKWHVLNEEENDEKYGDVEYSTDSEEIKSDIDIHYEYVKTEIVEKNPGESGDVVSQTNIFVKFKRDCGNVSDFNSIRGEDMTQDVKPSSICHTTGSGLQLLKVEEEAISRVGGKFAQGSSLTLQRDSALSIKKCREKTSTNDLRQRSFEYNDLLKHQMIGIAMKSFHCKVCYTAFTLKSNLRVHERGHTGEKPFDCQICSKSFIDSGDLKRHEKTRSGGNTFYCSTCSKGFSYLSHLKVHEKIRTGMKPFHCKICSKAFKNSSNLKHHEKIHEGEKPFCCKICSKFFTNSSNLKHHEKIHLGEKPFCCKICSRAFTRSGHLKRHEKIHEGGIPFCCKICSKSLTNSSNLKRHEKIHEGKKTILLQYLFEGFH